MKFQYCLVVLSSKLYANEAVTAKKVDNAALETINIKPRVGGKALNCDLKDTILALILMG